MDTYRFDHSTGQVYEYRYENQAYIFIGTLKGRTEIEFIGDHERSEIHRLRDKLYENL